MQSVKRKLITVFTGNSYAGRKTGGSHVQLIICLRMMCMIFVNH